MYYTQDHFTVPEALVNEPKLLVLSSMIGPGIGIVHKGEQSHNFSHQSPQYSQTSPSSIMPYNSKVVRLVATTDGEQYTVVDVTGAPDGQSIRRRILKRLQIPENLFPQYTIHPSEVGYYALGGALNDNNLYNICVDQGTPSGSLKFFIAPSPDQLS